MEAVRQQIQRSTEAPKLNHYTYLLVLKNTKFYIGVRSCKCDPSEDEYYSSSKYIKRTEVLAKIVLCQFKTRQKALKHEIQLHSYHKVAANPLFVNRACATSAKFDILGNFEARCSIVKACKRRKPPTEATKNKISKALKNNNNGSGKIKNPYRHPNNSRFIFTNKEQGISFISTKANAKKIYGLIPSDIFNLKRSGSKGFRASCPIDMPEDEKMAL